MELMPAAPAPGEGLLGLALTLELLLLCPTGVEEGVVGVDETEAGYEASCREPTGASALGAAVTANHVCHSLSWSKPSSDGLVGFTPPTSPLSPTESDRGSFSGQPVRSVVPHPPGFAGGPVDDLEHSAPVPVPKRGGVMAHLPVREARAKVAVEGVVAGEVGAARATVSLREASPAPATVGAGSHERLSARLLRSCSFSSSTSVATCCQKSRSSLSSCIRAQRRETSRFLLRRSSHFTAPTSTPARRSPRPVKQRHARPPPRPRQGSCP